MKARVPKCHAVPLYGSTGRSVDPKLMFSGQKLPFIANTTIKFLGLPVQIHSDVHQAKLSICEKLQTLLQAVDVCPVTRQQKLKLYKLGICPRYNWPLILFKFPISWIECCLEATATRSLKR